MLKKLGVTLFGSFVCCSLLGSTPSPEDTVRKELETDGQKLTTFVELCSFVSNSIQELDQNNQNPERSHELKVWLNKEIQILACCSNLLNLKWNFVSPAPLTRQQLCRQQTILLGGPDEGNLFDKITKSIRKDPENNK